MIENQNFFIKKIFLIEEKTNNEKNNFNENDLLLLSKNFNLFSFSSIENSINEILKIN